jgi:hypothetical protein
MNLFLISFFVIFKIKISEQHENTFVGFKRLGNYCKLQQTTVNHFEDEQKHIQFLDISDENGKANLKLYFVSIAFRANWMNSQSFCNSYGMDLVALESEHEGQYFKKCCEINTEFFEQFSHIGGVLTENESWHWITSQKEVNFDLNITEQKTDTVLQKENCLQLLKLNHEFSFGRINCFGNELHNFVCQKMIIKEDRWASFFGK